METTVDTLRPTEWAEYVGQPRLKDRISKEISASLESVTPLPHVLLIAPPGSGKTALARIIADTLGDDFTGLVMPVDQNVLEQVVWEFQGVLFLDEIHRATKKQQEDLLSLLEFGFMQSKSGLQIPSGWLTIIAATTKGNLLDPAVLERFSIAPEFEDYTVEEMALIVLEMANKVSDASLEVSDELAIGLGRAAGGRPRVARGLVLAARTLVIHNGTMPSLEEILQHADVDEDGLTSKHIKYLELLKRFNGKSGLSKIASLMNINPQAVQDVERLLFEREYIDITDRGRQLTGKGFRRVSTGSAEYKRKPRTNV